MPTSTKADLQSLAGAERGFFLREILGIIEAIAAVLLFIALVAESRGELWAGAWGQVAAERLILVLGQYVAFVVPVMIGVESSNSIFGTAPLSMRLRSWARFLGGFVLVFAVCGALTMHTQARFDGDREALLRSGGVIGNFLIHPGGLNLSEALGHAGALVTFYGAALVGLVLFTERMIRELLRLIFRLPLRVLFGRWWAWLFVALRAGARRMGEAALPILRIFHPRGFIEYVRAISFRAERRVDRVMATLPILEIEPGQGRRVRVVEPPKKSKKKRRGGRVLSSEAAEIEAAAERYLSPPGARDAAGRRADQPELSLFPTEYELPPLEILAEPPPTNYRMSDEEAEKLSTKIEETLAQFRIQVEVTEVVQGPVVTRFALHVAPGIRIGKILALENDIAMAMRAQHVRILAPIPGQSAVGIEVPNKQTNPVMLKELLESPEMTKSKSALAFALGKNIAGEPVIADLATMPHILIAGATGAGKSVCLNCIIASILFRNPPELVKMVMIDPKRVELSIYQAIPHLMAPVVCEPRKAAAALAWTVEQMESRYKLLAEVGVRNIDGYNAIVTDKLPNKKAMGRELKFMPKIVVVLDELADLMMVAKNEVEEYIIRLAQMARAVGIHLILATQRPSVNVITGIIKANFPTRIAFRVSSKVDSRTILDMNGAESLLGRGDMLYSPGGVKPFRIQGAFVSDAEIEALADAIRAQEKARYEREDFDALPTPAERAKAQLMKSGGIAPSDGDDGEGYEDEVESGAFAGADSPGRLAIRGRADAPPLTPADMESLTDEDLYDVALRLVLESRKASVSYIQRRLKIGYARAGRVMDMLEERGVVGPYQGSKPRDLIVDPEEFLERMDDGDA
jgi:DNA segregation ATPase FtsK/SpoIIIE-like protein